MSNVENTSNPFYFSIALISPDTFVSTAPANPDGKKQHVVEILNLVDHGSSAVVAPEPASDYNAETALRKLAEVFTERLFLQSKLLFVHSY